MPPQRPAPPPFRLPQSPVEVMHDIVEPSFRINEKYQTYVFALKSGQAITGLVLEETPEAVKVIDHYRERARERGRAAWACGKCREFAAASARGVWYVMGVGIG